MRCTEIEYVAIVEAGKKTIWMTDYLEEWARSSTKILNRNSQSVIQLAKEPGLSFKEKTQKTIPFHLQVSERW